MNGPAKYESGSVSELLVTTCRMKGASSTTACIPLSPRSRSGGRTDRTNRLGAGSGELVGQGPRQPTPVESKEGQSGEWPPIISSSLLTQCHMTDKVPLAPWQKWRGAEKPRMFLCLLLSGRGVVGVWWGRVRIGKTPVVTEAAPMGSWPCGEDDLAGKMEAFQDQGRFSLSSGGPVLSCCHVSCVFRRV